MNLCSMLGKTLDTPQLLFVKTIPICNVQIGVEDNMGNMTYYPVQFVGEKAKECYLQVVSGAKLQLQGELRQNKVSLGHVSTHILVKEFELFEKENKGVVLFKKKLSFYLLSWKAKITFFLKSKLVRKEVESI